MKERGYVVDHLEQCIVQLIAKLKDNREFPHEIGLFLGYPQKMCRALLKIDLIVQNALGVGKFMETKKKRKSFLKSIINVQLFIWINGPRGKVWNGWQ